MLDAKFAVVSGAASGLGRHLARRLARHGAEVWALDVDEPGLQDLADEAREAGLHIETRRADVTVSGELAAVRDEILGQGKALHYWINNAGISWSGDFRGCDEAMFSRILQVDLIGLVNGTRVALQAMETAGVGKIVNIGSIAGHVPAPYLAAYSAAKHGVTGFTRALRAELRLRQSPVRLLLVSPGFIQTKMIRKDEVGGFPEWLSFLIETPDAVADEIVYGMMSGVDEITPTVSGRLMKAAYRVAPKTTVSSAHRLLAKNWKDALRGRFSPPTPG